MRRKTVNLWYKINENHYRALTPKLVVNCLDNLEKWQSQNTTKQITDINLNSIVNPSSWSDKKWLNCLIELGQPINYMHRKLWEYAQTLFGLKNLGVITEEKMALGVACGHEPLLFYLANNMNTVYAVDLYDGEFSVESGEEADPRMLTSPEIFSPFSFNKEHLKVLRMDATSLDFPDKMFDLLFCLSSIEHFGNYFARYKAIQEMARVLKKEGVAAITTELILNNVKNKRYFSWEELNKLILDSGMSLVEPISLNINKKWFNNICLVPLDNDMTPYFILQHNKTIFTSVMLFLRKE